MGLLDMIGTLAGEASQGDNAKVIGGLIQTLESHPDGIQGMLNSFTQNGMGEHAAALANGESPSMTPEQVQQGLSGSGLIEKTAEKAGVSPEVVKVALTTVLPLVMAHFANRGGAAAGAGENGVAGVAEGLLKKFL